MTDHKELPALFEAFLAHLDGEGPEPDITNLDDALRHDLVAQFAVLRRDHGLLAGAPDLPDDPGFAALGFDRAGESIEIAGAKVRRARSRAGLDFKRVIELATNAGGKLGVKDLHDLERATSTPLAQTDATALLVALDVTLPDLESDEGQIGEMRRFLGSPEFDDTVRRWCDERSAPFEEVSRQAKSAMLAGNFRGGEHTDQEQLLALLHIVLEHLEVRWRR